MEGKCRECFWLSDLFTCVCVNDASDHCADFVAPDMSCPRFHPAEPVWKPASERKPISGNRKVKTKG